MKNLTRIAAVLAVASLPFGTAVASDESASYPERNITLIVPYGPGAAVDTVGRLVGEALQDELGQTVVVENKAGAGSQVGTAYVTRAKPDGYTLLLTTLDAVTLLPQVRDLPYEPDTALIDIARVARIPYSMQINPDLGIRNLDDLDAHARENPGALRYGSTGIGSLAHVAMALYASKSDLDMIHVPYTGMAASVNDLVAGHIDLTVVSTSTIAPYVDAGSVVPLALTTAERDPDWPDVPTVKEHGVEGVEAELEFLIMAPAGVAPDTVEILSTALRNIVAKPNFQESLVRIGMTPAYLSTAEILERRRDDSQRWSEALAEIDME